MKYGIPLKFLAIILCAACLLGAVGSGLGIVFLTEEGLYQQDPATLQAERLAMDADYLASNELARYAAVTLGGWPERQLYDLYDTSYGIQSSRYGYQILDADGTVLKSCNETIFQDATVYASYPAHGSYPHVRAIEPVEEPEETEPDFPELSQSVTIHIPQGQSFSVFGIAVSNADNSEGISSQEPLGFLQYTQTDGITFQAVTDSTLLEDTWLENAPLSIQFTDQEGSVLYEATSAYGVGHFYYNDTGMLCFQGYLTDNAGDSFVINNLPAGKNAMVSGIRLSWNGGSTESNFYELGYLCSYDDGTVGFSATTFDAFDDAVENPIIYICFTDVDGDLLYAARNPDGVGSFFHNSYGGYCFQSTVTAVTETQTQSGTVSAYINVYTEPDLSSEVSGSLGIGYPVYISAQTTVAGVEWGYIRDLGWVLMNQITLTESSEGVVESTVPSTARSSEATPEDTDEDPAPMAISETEAGAVADSTEPTYSAEDFIFTSDSLYFSEYYDTETDQLMRITYSYAQMPSYTLVLYLLPDAMGNELYHQAVTVLWNYRTTLFYVLAVSILLFAIFAVYLCCAAGHKTGVETLRAGGLNALPLDLYLGIGCLGLFGLAAAMAWGTPQLLTHDLSVGCGYTAGVAYGMALLFVGFCFACVAQFKTPDGFWWRNLLSIRCCKLFFAACIWCWHSGIRLVTGAIPLAKRFLRWCGRCILWCWNLIEKILRRFWDLIAKTIAGIRKIAHRMISLLPLTWQWLLAGAAMMILLLLGLSSGGLTCILCLGWCVVIVLYGAHCFGILAESAKGMSKGNLDIQVDDPWMIGSFQEFSQDLNALAGVAVVAAQKQLKSERMKTELITNVSHDIKTPLTSIINYVDLLQKPHSQEEGQQYLEVLERQSQRLKKLIEDLIEMSKANTGNMAVEITPLNAVETVTQALGEFADKLEKAQLTPVFRRPEGPVTMMGDGRLSWRVLSNLLGNAVKYALPGTRLYIDLMELEGKVVLSLKNISRDELNVDAAELMERFVRGDSSRNTEGSGLGLNIAKSLMELQKGQLQLLVDGDLFKVTLIFPGV